MANWFVAKISFQQADEKGNNKAITQQYLFDAVSYTDCEARVTAYVAPENPDFTIVGLTKIKLHEVFFIENNAETWFKCKVQYIVFDEKSQKEKLVPFLFLINANDIKECFGELVEKLGKVQDYLITDINVTKILDVIPYEEGEENLNMELKPSLKPLAEVLGNQMASRRADEEADEAEPEANVEVSSVSENIVDADESEINEEV
jgi:hypothetical protein